MSDLFHLSRQMNLMSATIFCFGTICSFPHVMTSFSSMLIDMAMAHLQIYTQTQAAGIYVSELNACMHGSILHCARAEQPCTAACHANTLSHEWTATFFAAKRGLVPSNEDLHVQTHAHASAHEGPLRAQERLLQLSSKTSRAFKSEQLHS